MTKTKPRTFHSRTRRKIFDRRWNRFTALRFIRPTIITDTSSYISKKRFSTAALNSSVPVSSRPPPQPTRSFVRYYNDTMYIDDMPTPSRTNHNPMPTVSSLYHSMRFTETTTVTSSTNTNFTPTKEVLFEKELDNLKGEMENMEL